MSDDAIIANLRDALEHNLPADMRQGIVASIEHLTGKAEPSQTPPDTRPRDALTGEVITLTPKVTVGGKPLFDHSSPRNPYNGR
jgi:hypothetical protein